MPETPARPPTPSNRLGVLLDLAASNLSDFEATKDEACLATALSDIEAARETVRVPETEPIPRRPTFVQTLDRAIVDLQQYEQTWDQQAFDNTLAGLREARAAAAYLESTIGIDPVPATTVDLRSATPLDLVDASLGLLARISNREIGLVPGTEDYEFGIDGSIANLQVASAMLRDEAPVPQVVTANRPRPSALEQWLLAEIGNAKNIARDLAKDDSESLADLEALARNLEAIRASVGTLTPQAARIVLADDDGNLFDRGACPGQVWPTANPLGALNWPDVETARAALRGRDLQLAFAKATATGFKLRRAIVAIEDLPGDEGALSGVLAVAG